MNHEISDVPELRKQIGSGLISFGNMAVASLCFSQLILGETADIKIIFLGFFLLAFSYVTAIKILKERR
jgi:hypothetical protein